MSNSKNTKPTRSAEPRAETTPKAKSTLQVRAEVLPEVAEQQILPMSLPSVISTSELDLAVQPTHDDTLPLLAVINEGGSDLAIYLLRDPPPDVTLVVLESIEGLTIDALLDRADQCVGAIRMLGRKSAEQVWLAGQAWSAAKAQVRHGEWLVHIEARGYSDSTTRQAIRVFEFFPTIESIQGLTITRAKEVAGVVKAKPARPAGGNKPDSKTHAGPGSNQQSTAEVIIEDGSNDTDPFSTSISTTGLAMPTVPRANSVSKPQGPSKPPQVNRAAKASSPKATSGHGTESEVNPPEDEVPIDWKIPGEPFLPPGSDIQLPGSVLNSVEWLRQAASFLAWIVADNGLIPPLQFKGDLDRFNTIVAAWKDCQLHSAGDKL